MADYTLHTFRPAPDTNAQPRRCAAVGFFDGVHRGHQFLIEQLKHEAAARHLSPIAISFEEHPRLTLTHTRYWPELLTTNAEKLRLLAQTGIDACALLHFSREMSMLTSGEFMRDILHEKLGVDCLIVGYDHHFGSDLSAGFKDYVRHGREIGVEVLRESRFEANDLAISSSAVRRLLTGGNVEMARACLGRPYMVEGTIVEGHHAGTRLGFPTANLRPDCPEQLIPGRGVYAVKVRLEGFTYNAMLNIGWRPTLDNGDDQTIEAHLLDYEGGDIYGKQMQLFFCHRVRDEHRFESLEALQAQLAVDADNVREMLSNEKI